MKLNPKQLSYLKGLDSKKKQRKFLLDCILENVIGESDNETLNLKLDLKHEKMLELINDYKNQSVKDVFSSIKTENLEAKEIIAKSKEPQPPMEFCVQITDLPVVEYCEICHRYPKIENSNKCESCHSCVKHIIENDPIFEKYRKKTPQEYTTNDFDFNKGYRDAIEKRTFDKSDYIDNENHLCWIFNRLINYGENPNYDYMIKLKEIALNYSEPKKEVEEKVDLSKELYLTCGESVIRVTDFISGTGFGIGHGVLFSESGGWSWYYHPNLWRKSTPEEIKSMLIKKLEADGLKVGCKVDCSKIASLGSQFYIQEIKYKYWENGDMLTTGEDCILLYSEGKFATIIPQENNELVNLTDEIKNIEVDFENVSQKENN